MKKWIFTAVFLGSLFMDYSMAVEEKTDATPEYVEEYYKKALESYKNRKYEESLDHLRHVIRSDLDNFNLRYLAAHDHWQLGNFEPAVIHMKKCIEVQPQKMNSYIDLALIYIKFNEIENAQHTLYRALEVGKDNNIKIPAKVYNVLSRTYLYQGKPLLALEHAENAKAAFEKNKAGIKDKLEAIMLEARAQLALGNFEKAEISILWGMSLRENNPVAQNLAGVIYLEWAKSEKKINHANTAVDYFQKVQKNSSIPASFREVVEKNLEDAREIQHSISN